MTEHETFPSAAGPPVVFCFDEGYALCTAVATLSLASHHHGVLRVVWIAGPGAHRRAADLRARLARPGLDIQLIEASDGMFAGWPESNHITRAAYLRLMIPSLLPDSRALYLDGDILVTAPLSELLGLDMGRALLAGCANLNPEGKPPARPICSDAYLNSGVLLMNLDAMRREGFLETCLDVRRRHAGIIRWHDQDILNKAAEGRKVLLDGRWNWQVWSGQLTDSAWQELLASRKAAVLHFLGPVKPWQEWCAPAIRQSWLAQAAAIGLGPDVVQRVRTLRQALLLARVFERAGDFRRAALVKDRVIASLARRLAADGLRAPLDIDIDIVPGGAG